MLYRRVVFAPAQRMVCVQCFWSKYVPSVLYVLYAHMNTFT